MICLKKFLVFWSSDVEHPSEHFWTNIKQYAEQKKKVIFSALFLNLSFVFLSHLFMCVASVFESANCNFCVIFLIIFIVFRKRNLHKFYILTRDKSLCRKTSQRPSVFLLEFFQEIFSWTSFSKRFSIHGTSFSKRFLIFFHQRVPIFRHPVSKD